MLMGLMAMIGFVSGAGGYLFGRQSLRGVTQPLLNPFLNSAQDPEQAPRQGADFLDENEILARIRAQTSGVEQPQTTTPTETPDAGNNEDAADATQVSLPVKVENQGVQLEVRSITKTDSNWVLNVALQNQGEQATQFLYSFIDLVDDQGRDLPTETRGLPSELVPQSDIYVGTIQVLEVPRSDAKSLTLTLTDYPQQSITLKVANIPIED